MADEHHQNLKYSAFKMLGTIEGSKVYRASNKEEGDIPLIRGETLTF